VGRGCDSGFIIAGTTEGKSHTVDGKRRREAVVLVNGIEKHTGLEALFLRFRMKFCIPSG